MFHRQLSRAFRLCAEADIVPSEDPRNRFSTFAYRTAHSVPAAKSNLTPDKTAGLGMWIFAGGSTVIDSMYTESSLDQTP
jgi:hypothetical protein